MSETKKKEVDRICKEKFVKNEIQIEEKYNSDNLFRNKQINSNMKLSEQKVEMVKYKEQKWYGKVFKKVLTAIRKIICL